MKYCLSVLSVLMCTACDPWRKNKCEWYVVPDAKNQSLAKKDWVTLCVRNDKLGKQKCYFQTKYKTARSIRGKTFRYNSMVIDREAFPRKILAFPETCSSSG